MYSVVLLMAMTGGADAPDGIFGGHGCHGGDGYACAGGYACTGGYGCNGSYGHGCNGGYGCTGAGWGCTGGVIVVPETKKEMKEERREERKEEKGKVGAAAAPATFIVTLPAEAKLTIDDVVTTSTTSRRVFISPELEAGMDYTYTLTAEFMREGTPMIVKKKIIVRAGEETTVSMMDAADIASR